MRHDGGSDLFVYFCQISEYLSRLLSQIMGRLSRAFTLPIANQVFEIEEKEKKIK